MICVFIVWKGEGLGRDSSDVAVVRGLVPACQFNGNNMPAVSDLKQIPHLVDFKSRLRLEFHGSDCGIIGWVRAIGDTVGFHLME